MQLKNEKQMVEKIKKFKYIGINSENKVEEEVREQIIKEFT